ncbi:aminotransferase-like domain-containing protein [Neobacillus sp. D3-1R]|uniref:aminotransferase-like domain-containing protein n=1 Tax=Neobacillus sp. D3-1R TaxID=3445778 RepID=UPI003FA123F1
MNLESFFSEKISSALKNDPPGAWMPNLPAGCIRLSSGHPDPEVVPATELKKAVATLIEEEKDLPLHYTGSPRIEGLKKLILKRLSERGMMINETELIITSGACQAIDLIARIFLDSDAVVAVESPTYMEALEVFQNYTKQIISVPVDERGLLTEQLEALLVERKRDGLAIPRFLYTIPTFQNPTGTTMTKERRKHLLQLAAEFDFLIVEDDAYGELSFSEPSVPLKAMDSSGRVLHVGSLSKVVAPGMRIGWVAGASEFIHALSWFKKDLDHPFAQSSMAAYLENLDFEKQLDSLRDIYRRKCTAMVRSLAEFLPDSVTWYVPDGGYFVWVKIPGVDTSELLTQALEQGVSFIPGKYFFLEPEDGAEYLRLSFSYANEEQIEKGIRRLGQLVSVN